MPTAEAFLEAIIANPDDDAPRLMYADWLEEQGDAARAEFIRVQIALARMGEEDGRREGLRRRERELLEANEGAWLGATWEVLRAHRFTRGLLDYIDLTVSDFWSHADALFGACPIRWLWLSVDSSDSVPALVSCAWLNRLYMLGLAAGVERAGAGLAAIFDSPHLVNLRHLVLCHNRIGPEGVTSLTRSGIGRLQVLCLVAEDIGVAGVEALANWTGLRGLTNLELGQNGIGSVGVEALCASTPLNGVVALRVEDNQIGPPGARALARTESLGRLKDLNIGSNPLGNVGVEELALSPHLRHLRSLDLSSTACGRTAARTLAGSAIADHLTCLDLSYNPLGWEGAAALVQSPRLAGLKELALSHTDIGADGARELGDEPLRATP